MIEQNLSRRERKKQETRDRILSVAREMLESRGFEATALEQIAEAADVSKGTFYNYFPNKDALLKQIAVIELGNLDQQIAEDRDQHTGPLAQIRHILQLLVSETAPVLRVTRRILLENLLHPSKIPTPIAEMETLLIDLVRQAQNQDELRSDLDPPQMTHAIVGAYLAASTFHRWLDTDSAYSQSDRALDPIVTALIDSLSP